MRRKLQRLWLRHKALGHYRRMIRYAQTQPPHENADGQQMLRAIGERWGDDHCVYCQAHRRGHLSRCVECELGSVNGCCDGRYRMVDLAKTWAQWLSAAEAVMAYISDYGVSGNPSSQRGIGVYPRESEDIISGGCVVGGASYEYYARIDPGNVNQLPRRLRGLAKAEMRKHGLTVLSALTLTLIRYPNDKAWTPILSSRTQLNLPWTFEVRS